MIKTYRYLPGWTVPCISPYVTKVVNYMQMTGFEHEIVGQDLTRLDEETPFGKLPKIDDGDETVADSTAIINYLKGKYGDSLDGDAGAAEKAEMVAWNRLIDDHLYWTAVIQPRWRETPNWEIYLRIIAGTDDVPPPLRAFADDFRHRIVTEFMHGGWGRMPGDVIYRTGARGHRRDGRPDRRRRLHDGGEPRSIDAAVASILRHIIDTPFDFDTKDYAAEKSNLTGCLDRMSARFGV